jgi:hypothetical protein
LLYRSLKVDVSVNMKFLTASVCLHFILNKKYGFAIVTFSVRVTYQYSESCLVTWSIYVK